MTGNAEELIAELRERAKHPATGSNVAQCMREAADRLAALTTPQEGDVRERLHSMCDCVPDLGPAHCHLCGNVKGEPVPWAECSAVRAAAPEPEWEWAISDQEHKFSPNRWLPLSGRGEETVRELAEALGRRVARRRKASPWDPVGGDDE